MGPGTGGELDTVHAAILLIPLKPATCSDFIPASIPI